MIKNYNQQIDKLNFHDSTIQSVKLTEDGLFTLEMLYYNWEGNQPESSLWVTKRLIFEVEHCLHFKFCSPGLSLEDQEIHDHRCLDRHSQMIEQAKTLAANRNATFYNTVAIRYLTHSYGEPIFGETTGFLELGGFNAKITWHKETEMGTPSHIPVKS